MKKRLLPILCAALCLCLVVAALWGLFVKSNRGPVVIAIIDTGISTNAIPSENILEGKNYLDPSLSTEDTYGHGTAVASVILKHLPEAQFVPLVSNAYDNGKIKQVDNDTFAQMIRDAVEYAEQKNVLVVASAGNDYATDGKFKYYPAGYDTVLAVGSVNKKENAISEFSQRGEWVNIYACGEEVTIKTLSGNIRESEGTSYSAAKVTAYAGEILQESGKKLTAEELRQKIIEKAKELPDGTKYIP